MSDIIKTLDTIESEAMSMFDAASDGPALESAVISYLGRKGKLAEISRQMSSIENSLKPVVGARLNELRKKLTEFSENKKTQLNFKSDSDLLFDYTLPGHKSFVGHAHPLMDTVDLIVQIFRGMGFGVASGPDIETNFYNFDALNTPESHPARDLSDTFYIDHNRGYLLRTHTSTVQIRTM
jgi:phenylalanyl-tRNA synthetase alpha chain